MNLSFWTMTGTCALLGAGAFLTLPDASAGGGEVFCDSQGNEIEEAWSLANLPLQMTLISGHNGTRYAPGFPAANCGNSNDVYANAALQSVSNAMNSWNGASHSGSTPLATPMFETDLDFLSFSLPLGGPPPSFVLNEAQQVPSLPPMSVINLWEPASTFNVVGGSQIVGFAQVWPPDANGQITDVDIALNTLSGPDADNDGIVDRPFYSFAERNVQDGVTYVTTTAEPASGSTFLPPVISYVGLEGVLTHELGHALGLGHSLVDGLWTPSASSVPTMGFTGHTESPLNEAGFVTTLTAGGGSCTLDSVSVQGLDTIVGGLLAAGAATLEADDVAAIASLYPSTTFAANTGAIAGTIRDTAGVGVRGAHVVAIQISSPELDRVGTFSRLGGQYELEGLEPGDYLVYVEPVDDQAGGLYNGLLLPNYVDTPANSGCVANPPFFTTEFYNPGDTASWTEPPMFVGFAPSDAVTVTAGAMTSGIDIAVDNGPGNGLTVCDLANCQPSARGIQLAPAPGVDPILEFRVQVASAHAGKNAYLLMSPIRGRRVLEGQLLQADSNVVPAAVPISASGGAIFNYTVTDADAHNHYVAQVVVRAGNGAPLTITNPVSVFVDQP